MRHFSFSYTLIYSDAFINFVQRNVSEFQNGDLSPRVRQLRAKGWHAGDPVQNYCGSKTQAASVKATIPAKYWNPEKREVRKSYPQAAQVNALIKSKIVELEQLHLKSHTNRKHTSAEFLQKGVVRKYSSDSFFNYMERGFSIYPPLTREKQKLKDYTGDFCGSCGSSA